MIKSKIIYIQKYSIFFIPFILFLLLLRVSPMMYDGWAGPSYYQKFGGIIPWTSYVFRDMYDWINGRVSSNFFCGIIESFTSEIPLDIVGALVLTGVVICICYLINFRNKNLVVLIYTSMIVFIPYQIRTYVIQIALIQYIIPILLMLITILLIDKYIKKREKNILIIIYIISFIASTWMENSSLAYGVVLAFFCLMTTLKEKRIDYQLWVSVMISFFSGLFMILSTGMKRSRITPLGDEKFLILNFDRLNAHCSAFFQSIIYYGCGIFMIIAAIWLIMSIDKFIKEDNLRQRIYSAILIIFNAIAMVGFLRLSMNISFFVSDSEPNLSYFYYIQSLNHYMIISLFLLFLIWLTYNFLLLCNINLYTVGIYIFGIVSLLSVFFTSQIGARIYSPFYFAIAIIACLSIGKIQLKRKSVLCFMLISLIMLSFIISVDYQILLTRRIYEVQSERNLRIDMIKNEQFLNGVDKNKYYILPKFNVKDVTNGGVVFIGDFHYPQFLSYYNLPPETKIIFSNSNQYLRYICEEENLNYISLENTDDESYYFKFIVAFKPNSYSMYQDIINTGKIDKNSFSFSLTSGTGYYRVSAYLIDKQTGTESMVDYHIEKFMTVQ